MKLFVGLVLVVVATTSARAANSATIATLASSEASVSSGFDPGCPKIVCAAIMNWEECAMLLPERCRSKLKDNGAWEEHILLYGTGSNESSGSTNKQSGSSTCSDICPDVYSPVCGSDGVKYSNPCKMKVAACRNPGLKCVSSKA